MNSGARAMKFSKKKAKKGTFKKLIKYIMQMHKLKLIIVVFAMILATLTNVLATFTIQNVVKEAMLMVENGSYDFSGVIKQILIMIVSYGVSIAMTILYLRIMIDVGQDTLSKFRHDIFKHMLKLPLKFFDENKHGAVMSYYTNDVEATRQLVSQSLPQLIVALLTIIGYLTAMFITSPILSLITLATTFVIFIANKTITTSSRKYFAKQQKSLSEVNGYIEEMIEGQKVVKVFNYENRSIKQFKQLNEGLYQNASKASIRSGMLVPITVNIGYLGYAISSLSGAHLIIAGLLTIPQLIAFLLFTRNFTAPLNQLSNHVNFVGLALAGADRIFELLEEEPEIDNGHVTLTPVRKENGVLIESDKYTGLWAWKDKELIELKGDVRFNNVTFAYVEKNVLEDISLFAKPGEKIAFVGSTGAGKTTITNLINRFYEIKSGTITFDGIDIKTIKKYDLRSALGMVLQDTNLFTGTVFENMRFGNLYASDEAIIEACKMANAHEFIMKLPEGYNSMIVDNGSNLSQGQRQLLAIARAIIANPPVLILDEATSSVDTYTEKLIQDGMDKLMKGRTVFIIAHRLSTIRNAEAIMVLEHGKIIERGHHEALIEQRGKYYQLYTGAFELE